MGVHMVRRSFRWANLAAICLVVAVASCNVVGQGTKLPEYYGVYISDGGDLVQLGPKTPVKDRNGLGGKFSIVVFDKAVGSGQLRPEKDITLNRRAYVRKVVERVLDAPGQNPPKKINVVNSDRFVTLAALVELRFKPVEGKPEMVIAVPVKEIERGLYTLSIGRVEYPVGVGIGDGAEKESPHRICLDEYVTTIDHQGQFSWGKYLALSQRASPFGLAGERRVNGRVVTESKLKPCADADNGNK